MSFRRTIVILAFLLMCAAAVRAGAHHSMAMFDRMNPVTVEGAVARFEWTNPHGYLVVDVTEPASAAGQWTFELGSVSGMRARGMTRTAFKAGDKVRVIGFPRRDGAKDALFSRVFDATGKDMFPSQAPAAAPPAPASPNAPQAPVNR